LRNAESIKKSVNAVIEQGNCYHIVTSAIGNYGALPKVTDQLISVWEKLEQGLAWKPLMYEILARFSKVSMELGVQFPTIDLFSFKVIDDIKKNLYKDYVLHLGELLTTQLVVAYAQSLGHKVTFVDPARCLFFKKNGEVDEEKSYPAIRSYCSGAGFFFIGGFFGLGYDGKIKTWYRDGSDVSGAVFSRALKAATYCMGKDVAGILTGNPNFVEGEVIKEMNFKTFRKYTYAGTKAVHPDVLRYVYPDIPLRIFNPTLPDSSGTLITNYFEDTSQKLVGVAGKGNFILIEVYKWMMNDMEGQIRKLTSVFEKFHLSLDHIPTGIDDASVLIDKDKFDEQKVSIDQVISEIKEVLNPDEIKITENLAVIAVVSTSDNPEASAVVSKCLKENSIKKFSSQEKDGLIIFSLSEDKLQVATRSIHEALFPKQISVNIVPLEVEPCAR
jgi:aspartate kinase